MPEGRAICSVALIALLSAAAPAQEITSGLPVPVNSAALDDEATALSGNPAAAAFHRGLLFDFVRDAAYRSGQSSGDGIYVTGGLGGLTLGLAEEWLRWPICSATLPCARRQTWGLAVGGSPLALGVDWHKFFTSDNAALDGLSSWDLGALVRPARFLSLGLVVRDVNEPSGEPRRWTAALGLRPLGERVDLAFDLRWSESRTCATGLRCSATGTDEIATVDVKLVSGVHLLGQAGFIDDGRFTGQAGVSLDLGHVGVRYAPSFDGGDPARYGMRVRVSTDRWESIHVPTRKGALVDLHEALRAPRPGAVDLVFPRNHPDPLARTLEAFARLARDPDVQVVVVKGADIGVGFARAEEIRTAIESLRAAGKKTLFYLESGGDLEYSVAVSADRVYVAPQAVLTVNGFSATGLFAAAGLDKLGVKAEFFRVGAYKNAPDLFTRSDMSGEQREVENAVLDDLYGRYVARICERRRLDAAKVRAVLDQGLLSPGEAVASGLVDGLLYPDQLEEEAGKVLGGRIHLGKIALDEAGPRDVRWAPPPRIVVVRVEGDIVRGEGGNAPFGAVRLAGSGPIAKRIREAADDPRVAAIVVRIDSPGGDGNASDLIWRELVRARKEKKKPVVASMGDVAASGGYYVAAGADEIFAEPSTITGSIGVFVGHFDAETLYGKLGLRMETVKRGASADLFSSTRDLTNRERAMLQKWVEGFYDQFVDRVAEGRGMSRADVDRVARGRVWTGAQALEHKLVDHLGGYRDAIAAAKRRAGITDADVADEVSPEVGLSDLATAGVAGMLPAPIGRAARALHVLGEPGTLRAILPYDLEVH